MNLPDNTLFTHFQSYLERTVLCSLALIVGCRKNVSGETSLLRIDPAQAGANAIELYDANRDQTLDATELTSCPPLAQVLPSFDSNSDGKLNASEITGRFLRLYTGQTLAPFDCVVLLDGKPLANATVQLKPCNIHGELSIVGQGTTDAKGRASVALPADQVPAELENSQGLPPGVYRVEITHPSSNLPVKYNTESTLGCEVGATAGRGQLVNFSLKST